MDLLGNDALHSEDMMREMWGDSMKACNCSHARITYEDFLLLMKGQTRDTSESELSDSGKPLMLNALDRLGGSLRVVMEEKDEEGLDVEPSSPRKTYGSNSGARTPSDKNVNGGSFLGSPIIDGDGMDDGPLTMDDDGDMGASGVNGIAKLAEGAEPIPGAPATLPDRPGK